MSAAGLVEPTCAITPELDPNRFSAPSLMPGKPTHTMPCCMDRVMKYCKVESLSPLKLAEMVKPPATLSFQAPLNQRFELASANFLNCQDTMPM